MNRIMVHSGSLLLCFTVQFKFSLLTSGSQSFFVVAKHLLKYVFENILSEKKAV